MLDAEDFNRLRDRNGMKEADPHRKLVAAIEAAVRACGIRTDAAVHAVVGGIMGSKLAKLESDGSVSWNGEHGWDLKSAMPGYLASPELELLRQRDRELAGANADQTARNDAKAAMGAALADALSPKPGNWTLATIGEGLVNNL